MHKTHLLLLHVTADVEEGGRVTAVQLDDVHGGHGQAGPVDQTANVAVHLHVVQVVLGCLHLTRLGLRRVLRRRGIKNVILRYFDTGLYIVHVDIFFPPKDPLIVISPKIHF